MFGQPAADAHRGSQYLCKHCAPCRLTNEYTGYVWLYKRPASCCTTSDETVYTTGLVGVSRQSEYKSSPTSGRRAEHLDLEGIEV